MMVDMATDVNEWNRGIIADFRANDGKVGGQFEGAPMLLLHTTGAKSGETRVNPLVYQDVDGTPAIFGSYAGAEKNPAWFHNLVKNPDIAIEIGTETRPVRARIAGAQEREPIWTKQKQVMPGFAEYEAKTDREIPVVLLEPR